MNLEQTKKMFKKTYNCEAEVFFHAPGRVNLIGEHTDYNGGHVFPCALSFGTYAAVSVRKDDIVRFSSTNFNLQVEVSLKSIKYEQVHDWANYPKGVILELLNSAEIKNGLNILYSGNIPNGAGLSSSASIEVLTAVIFNEIFKLNLDMVELVKLSQRAENNFIGVQCGIMDQFAVGMGKTNHAILLDCNSLEYKYVPVNLQDYKLVIANTNKRRGLADSKYNERRTECYNALADLQKKIKIEFLCELSNAEFDEHLNLIQNLVDMNRAKHIVYENNRTLEAVTALQNNNLIEFGRLMNESHASLKDLYEVTGKELDILAESAQQFSGCIGSRMTGAGFGGCTVSVVKANKVADFINGVGEIYTKGTGLNADFYIADIGDGATKLTD